MRCPPLPVKVKAERIVVSGRALQPLRNPRKGEEILIRIETPTLVMGLPSEWLDGYAKDPDSFGFVGERDTMGAALLADSIGAHEAFRFIEADEEDGLVVSGFQPE